MSNTYDFSKSKKKKKLITRKQLQELLDISYTTILRWEKSEFLNGYKIGKKVYYASEDIENLLTKN